MARASLGMAVVAVFGAAMLSGCSSNVDPKCVRDMTAVYEKTSDYGPNAKAHAEDVCKELRDLERVDQRRREQQD